MDKKEYMKKWLKHHKACVDGYKWAVENCNSLDEVWEKAKPEWVIWVATREGTLTDKKLHEFALWCAEQVRHTMQDERSIAALDAKRLWIDGKITDEQLSASGAASGAAARAAAGAASGAAAWAAAWAAAGDAAGDAAWDAAWAAQKNNLLKNSIPQWNIS